MESLYTKYRPQTFADVVGQQHVVTTLEHAVLEGRTSHAYLFCGPRGTGKTTMARLLAKALMCEQGAGHLPDGSCEQCRLIAAGDHPDVYELDAASRTGVDNVREEIISRVSFAPARSAYKMYIIDEVHMLTTAAFNALLKTLEEPPAHVVFVLCTTDPQKIPETILSRVQRFDFHAISNADIEAQLAYICEREGFRYDPEALELVVRHARGGMRDAISELEQLSVSGGGTISVDVARDVLGEVSASTLERMSEALANRDVAVLFAQVESLVEVGRDLLQFTRALASRLRDVYVVCALGERSAPVVMAAEGDLPALSREARAFGSVDRVARALQILSDASIEMRVAPNQRLVLEVALTKIARPQTELTLEALADRVASLERQVAALSAPSARRATAEAPAAAPATARPAEAPTERPRNPERTVPPAEQTPAQATRAPEGAGAGRTAATAAPASTPPVQQAPAPQRREAPAAPAHEPAAPQPPAAPRTEAAPNAVEEVPSVPAATTATDEGELQRRWRQVVEGLRASHPQYGSLLIHATAVEDDGQQLFVSLPERSSFACRMLERADVRAAVDPAVAAVFGPRRTIFAEVGAMTALRSRAAAPSVGQPSQRPVPQRSATDRSATQVRPAAAAEHASAAASAPVRSATGDPQAGASGRAARAAAQAAPQPEPTSAQWAAAARQAPTASQQSPTTSRQAAATTQRPPATSPVSAGTARQASASRSTGAPQPGGAPQSAKAPQQTYAAPWEAAAVSAADDDWVPYDDAAATPYEDEYLYDTPEFADQPPQAPATGVGSRAATTGFASASNIPPTQAPSPSAGQPPRTAEPPVSEAAGFGEANAAPPSQSRADAPAAAATEPPQDAVEQSPEPAPATTPVVEPATTEPPAPLADPVSALAAAAAAERQPEEHAAPPATTEPSVPTPEEPAAEVEPEAKKPARTRRQTSGIPEEILSMMRKVFGEGITYTSLAPDEAGAEEDEPEDVAEVAMDEGLDEDADAGYADEPVDDADYEDDEA